MFSLPTSVWIQQTWKWEWGECEGHEARRSLGLGLTFLKRLEFRFTTKWGYVFRHRDWMIRIEHMLQNGLLPPFEDITWETETKQKEKGSGLESLPSSSLALPVCCLFSLFSTRLSLFPGLCSLSFPLLFPLRCLQHLIFLQQLHQQSPIIFFLLIQDASASFYSVPLSFGFQSLPKLNLRSFFTGMKKNKTKNERDYTTWQYLLTGGSR